MFEEIKDSKRRLLCPSGDTAELKSYQDCNWEKVPSNQILTRSGEEDGESAIKMKDVRLTLLKIADTIGPGGKAHGFVIVGLGVWGRDPM